MPRKPMLQDIEASGPHVLTACRGDVRADVKQAHRRTAMALHRR
jgi:hypothetical protein